MKGTEKRRAKVLSRAYDKAANMLPGQRSPLTPEEEELLLGAIARYRDLVWRPRQKLYRSLAYPHLFPDSPGEDPLFS